MSFLTAKNFDKILEYCLGNNNTGFLYTTLWEKLFQDLTTDDVSTMLDEMEKLNPEAFEFELQYNIIRVTPRTKLFFENGGFRGLEKGKLDKISKQKEFAELEKKKIKKEIENLEWGTKVSKFQVKTKFLPYFISVLSILIALFSYFKPTDKSSDKKMPKNQVVHIVDSISTLNQIKSIDSVKSKK